MGKAQTFFTALADRTRRRILNLMRNRELCVYDLVDSLNISQPKVSRHLAFLRSANIVSTRREGKWILYKINDLENCYTRRLLQNTLDWLETDLQMKDDYNKLMSILTSQNAVMIFEPNENILPKTNVIEKRSQEIETFLL